MGTLLYGDIETTGRNHSPSKENTLEYLVNEVGIKPIHFKFIELYESSVLY